MATIELKAKHNPFAWILYFTKLEVLVDGQPTPLGWGTHQVEVPPGDHHIAMSFGYLGSRRGRAEMTVSVEEGSPRRLKYRMPIFIFAKGKLKAA